MTPTTTDRPTHGSNHSHSADASAAGKSGIVAALVLIGGYTIVEVTAGFLAGSLALLAHAGHMLTDAVFLVLALVTMRLSGRSTAEHTYGYHRTEVIAALINALALWGISVWVLIEAYGRLSGGQEVDGPMFLIVGSLGLIVNIAAVWTVHGAAQKNATLEGTFQHMITDLLGSVAVVVAAVLVWAFGWHVADPVTSMLIGVLILTSTWRLLSRVVDVLLEGTPEHIDLYALCHRIEELDGVTVIHDVHCWTLAPGYIALTAHLLVDPEFAANGGHDLLLDQVRDVAYDEFNIQHITVQVETKAGRCLEAHHVDHLLATARTGV